MYLNTKKLPIRILYKNFNNFDNILFAPYTRTCTKEGHHEQNIIVFDL